MAETLILSVAAFVGTNIDDLFLNAFLYAGTEGRGRRGVLPGKYLGMGILVGLSLLGARGLGALPAGAIRWLGLVPVALGLREILSRDEPEGAPAPRAAGAVLNAAAVTVANGADNMGVYIPLFAGFAPWQTGTAVLIFALLTGAWCALGRWLADLPALGRLLTRYRPVLVPAVYIALGLYILL